MNNVLCSVLKFPYTHTPTVVLCLCALSVRLNGLNWHGDFHYTGQLEILGNVCEEGGRNEDRNRTDEIKIGSDPCRF